MPRVSRPRTRWAPHKKAIAKKRGAASDAPLLIAEKCLLHRFAVEGEVEALALDLLVDAQADDRHRSPSAGSEASTRRY